MRTVLALSGLALANPNVGQGVYSMRLVEALQRQNADFAVVVPHGFRVPERLTKSKFVPMPKRSLPSNDLLRHFFLARQVLRFVREEFSGAVFHSPGPIAGGREPDRTVVTLHDCIYRSFPHYVGRFFLRKQFLRATERFAANASLVLTDSTFSKHILTKHLKISSERIRVLYPWVGPEFIAKANRDRVARFRRRLQLPERFWLYIGGYDYRKNVELLIEAYARAKRSRNLPPLVLAGSIPTKSSRVCCDVFNSIRSSSLNESDVLTPGVISRADLPDLYRAASLLIYPSLMEGFGLPPAEAIAVGTPVHRF